MAKRLPTLENIWVVPISNPEAKRFSCGLVGLKGELAARVMALLRRQPRSIEKLVDSSFDFLGSILPQTWLLSLPQLDGDTIKRPNQGGLSLDHLPTPDLGEIPRATEPIGGADGSGIYHVTNRLEVILNIHQWNKDMDQTDAIAGWGRRRVRYFQNTVRLCPTDRWRRRRAPTGGWCQRPWRHRHRPRCAWSA